MFWRALDKTLVISFSLGAAGILVCVAGVLDSVLPRRSVPATCVSMAALVVAIIVVVTGYTWVCDKCEAKLSDYLDRHFGKGTRTRSAELSKTHQTGIGDTKHKTDAA